MTRLMAAMLCFGILAAGTAGAQCPVNTWTGGDGDWSDGASWSLGSEPQSDECVTIEDGVLVQVTETDEVCAEITLGGPEDPTTNLQMWGGGGLTVTGPMTLGDGGIGIVTQFHGNTTVGSLDIVKGGYIVGGGTFTTGSMIVGNSATVSSFSPTGGISTVTGNMELKPLGLVVAGSGRLQVGGALTVGGRFTIAGGLSPGLETASLSVVSGGTFGADANSFGFTPLEVTGTAQLGGTLTVNDFDAEPGTYDVIIAGTVEGTFEFIQLPDDDWSWGIDGNTVWIKKEDQTPVEKVSWGDVKSFFVPEAP